MFLRSYLKLQIVGITTNPIQIDVPRGKTLRYKAQIPNSPKKKKKNRDQDEKDINFDSEIDLEAKKWAIGLEKKTPNYKNDKSRDHKEDY